MSSDQPGLDLEDDDHSAHRPGTALERIRRVSQELTDAARRARMSSRARKSMSGGGFKARRGARAMRWLFIISFLVIVAAPTLAATTYYQFFASDQFVSVADFTVSGGDTPAPDGLGALTGIPALAIVQDSQIVVNYIHSRAAVEHLERVAGLKETYSDPKTDALSRFDPQKPIEKLVKYWAAMSNATIKMPAGIVEIEIRAFHPADAKRLADATVAMSEDLINDMNDRISHDAVSSAEQELQRISGRLAQARAALEKARNQSGLLDASKYADSLNKLITETKSGLMSMQQQYDTQLKYVLPTAPQMRELKSRIDVTSQQVAELEAKLTSTQSRSASDPTIATAMSQFSELTLEQEIAERLYAGAAASLEIARANAERKMMYLKTFVQPTEAQQPLYPKRTLSSLMVLAGGLAIWGALAGLAVVVRNNMA